MRVRLVTSVAALLWLAPVGPAAAGPYGSKPPPPNPPSGSMPGPPRVPEAHPPPEGLRRHIDLRLGESKKPADEADDPEARRIEANGEIREIEKELAKKRAEHDRLEHLLDYVEEYPEQKDRVAYEDLEGADPDHLEEDLGDALHDLDDQIGKLEKERSKQKAKLAKALADLKQAEGKYADETRARPLPRDAQGNPVIDGPLGTDQPFDPSAKAPPAPAPTAGTAGKKAATGSGATGGAEGPSPTTPPDDGKKTASSAPSEPKSPADDASNEAARKIDAGAKKVEPASGSSTPAPEKKSIYLPRDSEGNPVIDAPLGQPAPRQP
jgi:hypothetical protein